MKIAVTGGTGFIGRHLVSALVKQGHVVRILTRSKAKRSQSAQIELFNGDLLNDSIELDDFFSGIDTCYHCAGTLNDSDKIFETNVLATKKLLDSASGKIRHWVQLSSIGVYGKHMEGIVTEKSKVNPTNLYEESKAKADKLVIETAREKKITYSIVRPSNVYGNDMVNQSLFNIISTVNKNLFFYIGDKQAIANYIHVDNVVEGLLLCGEKKEAENQIFNISDYAKLETIVNIIARSLNKRKPALIFPKVILKIIAIIGLYWEKWPLTSSRIDALTNCTVYLNGKIEEILNYKHLISIEDGFEQLTRSWQISNREKH